MVSNALKNEGQAQSINDKRPVPMNLRVLHGIGKKAGFDHERLSDQAQLAFGVDSMSKLSISQMWELADQINPGFTTWFKSSGKRGKATQKQLDYLQDLWILHSREKTKSSLLTWINNKRKQHNLSFPVDGPVWFSAQDMYKVVSFLLNERW